MSCLTKVRGDLAEPESGAGFGGAEFFPAEIRPFRPKFESKRSKPAKLNSELGRLWPQSREQRLVVPARNRRVSPVRSSTCLRIVTARGLIFTAESGDLYMISASYRQPRLRQPPPLWVRLHVRGYVLSRSGKR
eukprot:COSAG06_NODE_12973_length_1306_cov_63.362883_2_plen_134_part_00